MSSSPRPAPHPGNAGQPAPWHDAMPENAPPTPPAPSVPAQDVSEQTMRTTAQPQQERPPAYRTKPGATPPPLKLAPLMLNTDVQRRGIDPLVIGVMMGAIAAVIGLLTGLLVFMLK
jgi:hypothetical protein